MSDSATSEEFLSVAAFRAIDAIETLECVQHALLAVEELLEPEESNATKVTKVERRYLYALISSLNTRLWLDFESARVAVKQVADMAQARNL